MTDTKIKKRIPEFKNIQDEAEFWDTHDTTDFENEFKPVRVRVAPKLEHILAIRFDEKTLSQLQEQAEEEGIGPTTLVRKWVKERLYA